MCKPFAIYCSGKASRIVNFYSYKNNRLKFLPKCVIYDGESDAVIEQLNSIFGTHLVLFEKRNYSQNKLLKINKLTTDFIFENMKSHNADFLICFGKRILKKNLIKEYKDKLINFHPSLLPSFKGLKAIDQALESNVHIIGNTAHYVTEEIDSGKILLQSAMLTSNFRIYEDVLDLQFPMMKIIFRDILNYDVSNEDIYYEIRNRKDSFLLSDKIIIR